MLGKYNPCQNGKRNVLVIRNEVPAVDIGPVPALGAKEVGVVAPDVLAALHGA